MGYICSSVYRKAQHIVYTVYYILYKDCWELKIHGSCSLWSSKRTDNGKWTWISWAYCSYWVILMLLPRCLPKLRSSRFPMLSPLPAFIHAFPILHLSLYEFPYWPSHLSPPPRVYLHTLIPKSTFHHSSCYFLNLLATYPLYPLSVASREM